MNIEKILKTILIWLPSIVICLFFIPNALEKIFESNQIDKVVTNSIVLIIIGVILLIATILFLFDRTMIFGTALLATYMTCIAFIHMYKGKQFIVTILIVMCTIFASYLRKPALFHPQPES